MAQNTRSETMKSVKAPQPGGPEMLKITDVEVPAPGPRQNTIEGGCRRCQPA